MQDGDAFICEHDPRISEQLVCFLEREAQVGGSDLGQLAREPEAMQPELRVAARREHDPEQTRPLSQQCLELGERLRRGELVQVVDHQHNRLLQRLELGTQTLDHRGSFELGRRREPLHESLGADRGAQLLDQRKPETLRILLAPLHRHPGGPIAQASTVSASRATTGGATTTACSPTWDAVRVASKPSSFERPAETKSRSQLDRLSILEHAAGEWARVRPTRPREATAQPTRSTPFIPAEACPGTVQRYG